jgi:hypothetical protein
MKKILIAASLIIALGACNNKNQATSNVSAATEATAATPAAANAPVFEFEESTYDFGKITAGEKVAHKFRFKNGGKTPLIVSDAQTTCGCTVPEKPEKPIAPGETGVIKVVFNSEGKFGKQDKVITLTSNANPSTTQLHLVGEVEEKK